LRARPELTRVKHLAGKARQGQTLKLITKIVNYGRKKFYSTDPRVKSEFYSFTTIMAIKINHGKFRVFTPVKLSKPIKNHKTTILKNYYHCKITVFIPVKLSKIVKNHKTNI